MKKTIFFIALLFITSTISLAQNSIAKIKYEEAEEAFTQDDFQLTITKLEEAEKLLKSTNPKILYLKIMAESNIIKVNPYNDFTLLNNTKKQCAKYLTEYDNLPNNEDKFRDIYKVSEVLKVYPNTIEEFEKQKKQIVKNEETKKSNEVFEKQKGEENFKNFVFYSDFKIGLTLDETYKLYPIFKKSYKYNGATGFSIAPKNNPNQYQPTGLNIKNNIVYGYYIIFYWRKVDDLQYTIGTKTVSDIIKRFQDEFIFSPTESTTENSSKVSGADYNTKTTTYIWKKNNKTISLNFSKSTYLGENLSAVDLSSQDEDLVLNSNVSSSKNNVKGIIGK